MSASRFLAGLLAVALAYVSGRALGILLDVSPYATEAAAVAIVIAVFLLVAVRDAE